MFLITVVFQLRQPAKVGVQSYEFPLDVKLADVIIAIQETAVEKDACSWDISFIKKGEDLF